MAEIRKPRVLIIEGTIAAGKSILTQVLLENAPVKTVIIREPVAEWVETGILKKFYSNTERYAYAFQTFAFATRCIEINKTVDENPDAELFILERSPISDQIFMHLLKDRVEPVEYVMYGYWIKLFGEMLKIDLTKAVGVYLRTDIDNCMARLKSRGREGEDADSMREYQSKLIDVHDAFLLGHNADKFVGLPKCPYLEVMEIPQEIAALNFKTDAETQKRVAQMIFDKIL